MIARACAAAICLLVTPVWGEQRAKLWEKRVPGEVLAVVNADSNRITGQMPGGEAVSTANYARPSSESGTFEVIGSPHGVLLLAVNDKSQYVQLVAVDVVSGEQLWQVACTSLPVADLPVSPGARFTRVSSTFISLRNEVIALQQTETGKMLTAYDVRSGVELWRTPAGIGPAPINPCEMMKSFMPPMKGLGGRMARKAMEKNMPDCGKTLSAMYLYYTLPLRNLLMKVQPGGEVFMESVDLDSGQSGWSLRAAPMDSGNAAPMDSGKLIASVASKAAALAAEVRKHPKEYLTKMQRQDTPSAGAGIGNYFRGDFYIQGCMGMGAEMLRGTGACPPLRIYNTATGQLAWETGEGEANGWMAAAERLLVRQPEKVVAFKLSTGEKLYELAGERVAAIDSGFNAPSTYSDGDWIFWFELRDEGKILVALDTRTGRVAWKAPVQESGRHKEKMSWEELALASSRERVTSLLIWDKVLVAPTVKEVILLDKATGREVGREKPLEGQEIRAASSLDERSMLVVGDTQIRRFEVNPWRQVYATHIPQQGPSVLAALLSMAVFAAATQVRVPMMGPMPGTFRRMPFWLTPGGMAATQRFLDSLNAPRSLTKLDRRSAHYAYFNTGDAIHRVDALTGNREKMAPGLKKGSTFALDESRGVGCMIRESTLTGYQMPGEDAERLAAQYGDGMEIGFSESRRGQKLEASDKAKAAAAYLSSVKGFSWALPAGEDGREKAVLHLGLGQVYERLATVQAQEFKSWKDKAVQEYRSAASATCNQPGGGLEDLCQTATRLLSAGAPE